MEVLAAVGLAGNIAQFIAFGTQLVSETAELYRSTQGALAENIAIEAATSHLSSINDKLRQDISTKDETLEKLCESCKATSDELLAAMGKLKVKSKSNRWESFRKALRSVWSKEQISDLERRLAKFREELNLHISVDIREQLLQMNVNSLAKQEKVDAAIQGIIDAIIEQQDVFSNILKTQQALLESFHTKFALKVQNEHATTREEIIGETAVNISAEHEITRREIIQEIRRHEEELLSSNPPKRHWSVPFPRNPHFVGRDSQLHQLDDSLFGTRQYSKVAVIGLGGVGKTQTALELAYRTRDKYPECSVFWISATSLENIEQAYRSIAKQLQLSGTKDKKENSRELVREYLSQDTVGQWLLLVDNADDLDMWTKKNELGSTRLIDSLPKSNKGSLLFTTRSRRAATKFAQGNVVHILEMDENLAGQVLRNSLTGKGLLDDDETTGQLLALLSCLPLAIVQAAAYINENDITLADYVSLFDDCEETIIEILSEEFETEGRYPDTKNPIATTWLISFEQIRARDTLAADYLSFMACIDPKAIPLSLLPPAPSKKKEIEAFGTLRAYSFITKRPDNQSFDLHRLVHLATRNWLREQDRVSEWTKRVIAQLATVFPSDDHENRGLWRSYLPHVYSLQASEVYQEHIGEDIAWIERLGQCLRKESRLIEAETAFLQVRAQREKVLGSKHPDTLRSMANLVATYREQWRNAEALELGDSVMNMRKEVLGSEHPDYFDSVMDVALTYGNLGEWKNAEELIKVSVEARKRILGAEHPDTLECMIQLARTYAELGRWKESEALGAEVVSARKKVLGIENPDTLSSIGYLAIIFSKLGRWKEAESLELQIWEIRRRVLGLEHADTLGSMSNLAMTYSNLGRYDKAEELGRQVVTLTTRVFGPEHPNALKALSNYAISLWDQGKRSEAREIDKQVLEIRKRVLGDEHPDSIQSLTNLAKSYFTEGKLKQAEDLALHVLETRKRILGEEHPDTLQAMANLADTYLQQGRWNDAEELHSCTLETRERLHGNEHPDTLSSMCGLSNLYNHTEQPEKAEEMGLRTLESSKRLFGPQHPDTLSSMANLAITYGNQGRYEESEELELQVLELRRKALGNEHPDSLLAMANLACTYGDQGRWQESEDLGRSIIQMRRKVIGEENPETLRSMSNLAHTLRQSAKLQVSARAPAQLREAEQLISQVLEVEKRILGPTHTDTIYSMICLAETYKALRQHKEAKQLEEQILEIRKQLLGPDHPDI